jgi:ABC-2 type transport system ATP-binding protein
MIRVEGLIKDYGSRRAIDELTFSAEKGEILGFLGPNGAGKTTTMRILCGYMPPTAGKAEVAGFDVVEQSLEVRRRVGYMPETIPLYPDMSVFDYLKFMADLRKVPNVEERVDDVLDRLHLLDRADGYISNLSKGMRQRVGLAQAIIHDPEVLILDEPTIGLDPVQIIEVRDMIRDLGNQHTILLSTHILSEAQQVCNRVLIINKGRIVAEDTPERLQSRLTGAQRVVMRLGDNASGAAENIGQLVEAVSGVAKVSSHPDGQVEFETTPGLDPRPEVARVIVNQGYDLLEMRVIGLSLEEIFLQLTRDEPSALDAGQEVDEDADYLDAQEADED